MLDRTVFPNWALNGLQEGSPSPLNRTQPCSPLEQRPGSLAALLRGRTVCSGVEPWSHQVAPLAQARAEPQAKQRILASRRRLVPGRRGRVPWRPRRALICWGLRFADTDHPPGL